MSEDRQGRNAHFVTEGVIDVFRNFVEDTETRTTHEYYFYGRIVSGFGPSMDPHRCGDLDQPCRTTVETRKVTPWEVTSVSTVGNFDEGWKG